jgi:hypothetical protein
MTRAQVEAKVVELIHREPFVPFQVELNDGRTVLVPHARLAVNETGAGFVDPESGIIDIDFAKVRAIGSVNPKVGV